MELLSDPPSALSTIRIERIHPPFSNHQAVFDWWSAQTIREPHMLDETAGDLRQSLQVGILIYDGEALVGAAGIFPARTGDGQPINHQGRPVVELGSIVVADSHRCHGLGHKLVEERKAAVHDHNWFAVSVTSNCVAQHLLGVYGFQPMEENPELEPMRNALCLCSAPNDGCLVCPLHQRAAWYLPPAGP